MKIIYINERICAKKYKHFLAFFFDLNAGILNIPGNKFIANGYVIDNPKLIKVSLNNII